MNRKNYEPLLQDLIGVNLRSIVAERLQTLSGEVVSEMLAIQFFIRDKNYHIRISGDASGQLLNLELSNSILPDMDEYGKVILAGIAWEGLSKIDNIYIQDVSAVLLHDSSGLLEVKISLSDGSRWTIVNDCDNLHLLRQDIQPDDLTA